MKYRLGTVSDTCHWGFKPGLGAPNLTLIPSTFYSVAILQYCPDETVLIYCNKIRFKIEKESIF